MTGREKMLWHDRKRENVAVCQEEKKCCGMTGREKMLRYVRKRKNAACDRKELIRRSLDIFSSEKMRDDSMGGRGREIVG